MKKNEKEKMVYQVFQEISTDYDFLNNVISFNMHKLWKKNTLKRLKIKEGSKILDVCCGTGDLSFMCASHKNKQNKVIGLDFSENMLKVANKKKEKYKFNNLKFVHGNALKLPLKDNTFDIVIVGFGLRNTPDYEKVIREMKRVVKPNGRVACLDTSQPTLPVYSQAYWLYFKYVMPFIGRLLSHHKKEYQWLNDSTKSFLSKKELKLLFEKVGLKNVKVVPYALGAAALHIGKK